MAAARDPVALKLPAHGHPLQFSQLHCEIAVRLLCVSYLSSAHDLLFQLETATEVVFLKTGRARRPTVFAISAAILLLLIAASTAFWIGRRPRAAPGRSLVAIQRFKNLSADPAQEYFTSGMTEEIRDQLPKISAIRLLSRSAVDRYREGDIRRIATELGAGSVVEGSVRLDKKRIRIAVQRTMNRPGRYPLAVFA